MKRTFTEEQAEQLYRALFLVGEGPLRNQSAIGLEIAALRESTRKEIKELNLKIEESRESTRKEIKESEQKVGLEIAALRESTRKEIKALEKAIAGCQERIAETKPEILKWTAGFLLAQMGAIVALIKILQLL